MSINNKKGFVQLPVLITIGVIIAVVTIFKITGHPSRTTGYRVGYVVRNERPTTGELRYEPIPHTNFNNNGGKITKNYLATPLQQVGSAASSTLCNEKRWSGCPSGQKFYCPAGSGDAQCVTEQQPKQIVTPREEINPKSIVGLLCYYKSKNETFTGPGPLVRKGSGVIVNPQGYILTAKHIVDPKWTNWAYASTKSDWEKTLNDNEEFDYCEVGLSPIDHLPTTEEIKSINPSTTLIQPFPYIATLDFNPGRGSLSDLEYQHLDFAVLKITRPMDNCETFNLCKLQSAYPYTPVLYSTTPEIGNEVTNFGYPAEGINDRGGAFNNFLLKGAVGPLREYYGGDRYFKGGWLNFAWFANDVIPGRSGSPVFWKGYVVGIQVAGGGGQPLSDAVGMPAIYQVIKDNNLGDILSTN